MTDNEITDFIFKEFACTQEQAENFISTVKYHTILIQFRKLIKQFTPNDVNNMVAHVKSSAVLLIPEQNVRDLYEQWSEGDDEAFEASIMPHAQENPVGAINNLLQYLPLYKQKCFIRNLYMNGVLNIDEDSNPKNTIQTLEPRGRRKTWSNA